LHISLHRHSIAPSSVVTSVLVPPSSRASAALCSVPTSGNSVILIWKLHLGSIHDMFKIQMKKYILVIVDDYTRFTWVKFLKLKDETPEVVIKFQKQIQVGLNKIVRFIGTDNGTEFVNHDLTHYYESVNIFHQKSVPRTPQQNDVVERCNQTLVEAARTMLIFFKALMLLWAKEFSLVMHQEERVIESTTKEPDVSWKLFTSNSMSCLSLCTLCTPTNKELKILFQPMFDEYLEPPRIERPISPALAVPVLVNSACVAAESTLMDENPFALVNNNPFINIFALKPTSEVSSSGDASSADSTYITQTLYHLGT
nr:hypothetical protein [Tanacetum cinerariifolium]